MEELTGVTVMALTGFLGFMLTLPVSLLAAWRARLLPWWPALVLLLGEVAAQFLPGGYGLVVWAATLVALGYALARLYAGTRGYASEPLPAQT